MTEFTSNPVLAREISVPDTTLVWCRNETIVTLLGSTGGVWLKDDDKCIGGTHDFTNVVHAERIMQTLIEAWDSGPSGEYYETWEQLMWAFFPDQMGN